MTALQIREHTAGKNGHCSLGIYLNGTLQWCDELNLSKEKARVTFAKSVKDRFPAIDHEEIDRQLLDILQSKVEAKERPEAPKPDPLSETPDHIKQSAMEMLRSPDLLERIAQDFRAVGIAGERELSLTLFLVGVSRLLPKPIAAIVQGQSATGKSYASERIAMLFPPESVILAKQMTPQALFHMKPGSLKHRWIVAGERSRREDDDTAEATRALREMLSSGKLTKLMPVKVNNELTTELLEQDGPIAFVESTTLSKIFDEDLNRCILLATDERPEQTQRILQSAAAAYAGEAQSFDAAEVIQRHHTMQRLLKQIPVIVPYAQRLAELFPTDKVEARRAFHHMIGLVQACAFLHQMQRPVDREGRVVATGDDYEVAHHLLQKPLSRSLGDSLPDAVLRFYERLLPWANRLTFTAKEAAKHEANMPGGGSSRSVYGWLKMLDDADAVELVEEGKGRKPAVFRLTNTDPARLSGGILPDVKTLLDGFDCTHARNT